MKIKNVNTIFIDDLVFVKVVIDNCVFVACFLCTSVTSVSLCPCVRNCVRVSVIMSGSPVIRTPIDQLTDRQRGRRGRYF